jgi:hypothetical protein
MLGASSDRYAEFYKLIAFTFWVNIVYSELSTNFIMYTLQEASVCVCVCIRFMFSDMVFVHVFLPNS